MKKIKNKIGYSAHKLVQSLSKSELEQVKQEFVKNRKNNRPTDNEVILSYLLKTSEFNSQNLKLAFSKKLTPSYVNIVLNRFVGKILDQLRIRNIISTKFKGHEYAIRSMMDYIEILKERDCTDIVDQLVRNAQRVSKEANDWGFLFQIAKMKVSLKSIYLDSGFYSSAQIQKDLKGGLDSMTALVEYHGLKNEVVHKSFTYPLIRSESEKEHYKRFENEIGSKVSEAMTRLTKGERFPYMFTLIAQGLTSRFLYKFEPSHTYFLELYMGANKDGKFKYAQPYEYIQACVNMIEADRLCGHQENKNSQDIIESLTEFKPLYQRQSLILKSAFYFESILYHLNAVPNHVKVIELLKVIEKDFGQMGANDNIKFKEIGIVGRKLIYLSLILGCFSLRKLSKVNNYLTRYNVEIINDDVNNRRDLDEFVDIFELVVNYEMFLKDSKSDGLLAIHEKVKQKGSQYFLNQNEYPVEHSIYLYFSKLTINQNKNKDILAHLREELEIHKTGYFAIFNTYFNFMSWLKQNSK